MSLGHFRAMSMRILVETLISEGPRRVMYSHWLSVSLVGRQSCKIRWLFRLLRLSTWLRLRHQRKLCGWKVWSGHLASYKIRFGFIATARVLFILQRTIGFTRGL